MNVELRPITAIKPYANNPRHNEAAVKAVAASLKEFGFRQPIVVDQEGVIIVGHTRYKDFMGNHEWCFYGWREGAAR